MRWTLRGIDDARVWQARRPVTLTLAVAGAVILAATGVGCGYSTSVNSAPGCPTKGVGGDTLAPACVSQPETSNVSQPETSNVSQPEISNGGTTGITGPPVASSPANHGITGPVSISATSSPSTSPATPPQVTAISPASGPAAGGTSVTITGSGFSGATTVDFGGVSATITAASDTEITAISPAATGTGTVDITVITPNGTSATGTADQFSYVS
jgi:hypothetical protein